MSKLIDLTGQRFGLLTVQKYVGNRKWHCKCDCGNECDVFAFNLTRLHTTSCGCIKGGIIGRKFGKLIVESQIEDTDKYVCTCLDCGGKAIRHYKSLTQDRVPMCDSCGYTVRTKHLKEKVFIDGTQPSKIQLDKAPTKANKSGVVGVNWDKSRGKWQASIKFKGHKYNLGRYEFIQDAIDARKEAEKRIYGEFLEWYENVYKKEKE